VTFLGEGTDSRLVDDDDFAGVYFPGKPGTDVVQGAAFGCDGITSIYGAQAERANTQRVTNSDELISGHDGHRIGALEAVHGRTDFVLPVFAG